MSRIGTPMLGILILSTLLMWGLLACSTTEGTLLEDAAGKDKKESAAGTAEDVDPDPYEPQEEETGLEIRSRPRGADVYLNNRYMGITPVVLDDVEPGRHKLTLKKEGYYSESQWISYSGEFESYYIDLEEITGFLKVEAGVPEAEINLGSGWMPAGRVHEIPVGSYSLRVRAFGYQELHLPVRISMREVTELKVSLEEAVFSLSDLKTGRTVFNPRNAGLLGRSRIRFRVSTYGDGRAVILDEQGRTVFSRNLESFTTWDQDFEWDGRDEDGSPLPDGGYTVRIEAQSRDKAETDTAELGLRIDSSIVLSFRSLWSGSAGLLYVPSTDILPAGSVQVSSLVLAHGSSDADGATVRAPLNLGVRIGLGRQNLFELDTAIGGIIGYSQEDFYMPWFASAAFKVSLLRSSGDLELGSAAQVKLAYQNAYTDTLANFSGLSVGLPTSLRWGPLSVLISPELILSPWTVSYDSQDSPDLGAYGWLYGRFGLLVDFSPFSVGLSASLRTLPFHRNFALDLPFQTALELNWLIPNTQLFLSLSLAGEFESADSYYLMGGAGLGILN